MNKTTKFLLMVFMISLYIDLNESSVIQSKGVLTGTRWPTNTIAFAYSDRIDFDTASRNKVGIALREMERMLMAKDKTCIKFVPRIFEEDYILFVNKGDCSSGIGFVKGINQISLEKKCLKTSTIMHELMHRLGFDHEHSRHDRDDFIKVIKENFMGPEHNFESNLRNGEEFIDSPYDFSSITHYNSDADQNAKNKQTILSKFPSLVSNDKLQLNQKYLSKIDILKIQKLYECEQIRMPFLVKARDEYDLQQRELQSERFTHEAAFKKIDDKRIKSYLDKTFDTCGFDHYWPLEYPIVKYEHKQYDLVCLEKKERGESCRFSIECKYHDSTCVRFLFKHTGFCLHTSHKRVNKYSQKLNNQIFKQGKVIKDGAVIIKDVTKVSAKAVAGVTVDLLKSSYSSLKKLFD